VRWATWLGLLPAWTVPVWGAGDFLGSKACTKCHAEQAQRQSGTHHARALRPILTTELPAILTARPIRERGGAELEYRITRNGVSVTSKLGGRRAEALLEFAFGAGQQGITPVGQADGRFIEHRISYYTVPNRPALTMGHPSGVSRDALAALGLFQEPPTIQRCFSCHATNVQDGPDLSAMEMGVTCERCHGPGRQHVAAVRAGRPNDEVRRTILDAGRFPAKAQVQICGECHRAPEERKLSPVPEVNDPISIRFQPVGFLVSRCFLGSKNFSCVTCHDPHENARRVDDSFYTAKCLQCHEAKTSPKSSCKRTARQNCLPCHMQRLSPALYLTFTDHRIRVY
jgi:hypothetical protein